MRLLKKALADHPEQPRVLAFSPVWIMHTTAPAGCASFHSAKFLHLAAHFGREPNATFLTACDMTAPFLDRGERPACRDRSLKFGIPRTHRKSNALSRLD